MMAAYTMEIRPDSNQLDNTMRDNQILTEKDTNLPGFGNPPPLAKQTCITAISACIPVPDPADNIDTSGSTLNTKETGQYGISPYENLTSALLESEYGIMFEPESNAYRSRDRSYSLVPPSIGSINTPNSQDLAVYTANGSHDFTTDIALSCSLTDFERLGPIIQPNNTYPVLRQPVAELPQSALASEPGSFMTRQKKTKKTKKLNRSQSVYSLDPSHWKTAVLTSWYSFKHGNYRLSCVVIILVICISPSAIPTKPNAEFSDRPIWLMGEHYMDINPPISESHGQDSINRITDCAYRTHP